MGVEQQLTHTTGNNDFHNSGVVPQIELQVHGLQLHLTKYDLSTFLTTVDRKAYWARLQMKPNTKYVAPHFHPMGEITRVRSGAYFDADMNGNTITGLDGKPLVYTEGMIVGSGPWSSHMPWSEEGCDLEYFTPGGLVSLNREAIIPDGMPTHTVAEQTIEAAAKVGAPQAALRFAIGWMVQDEAQRAGMIRRYVP